MTIRDPDGKPILGVRVAVRLVQTERTGYLGATIPDDWHERPTAVTDDRGVASLPGLTRRIDLRSIRLAVAAAAPGSGCSSTPRRNMTPPSRWAPAQLAGAVRDDAGEPVPGVAVDIGPGAATLMPPAVGLCDPRGRPV